MHKKYIAAALFISLLSVAGFSRPSIAETPTLVSNASAPEFSLPRCVSADRDLADIQAVQKTNGRTTFKYDGYRKVLGTETSLELATRLAYAETLASNCPEQEDQIIDLIAAVIGNRVRIRRGDLGSVVFQRDQFASSLNIYSESRYRDFLCPRDDELWRKAITAMRINLSASKPSAPIPDDTVNYYLDRHSDRFKAPDWKLREVPLVDAKTRECIRVFRNPQWR